MSKTTKRERHFIRLETVADFLAAIPKDSKIYEVPYVTGIRPYPEHHQAFIDQIAPDLAEKWKAENVKNINEVPNLYIVLTENEVICLLTKDWSSAVVDSQLVKTYRVAELKVAL